MSVERYTVRKAVYDRVAATTSRVYYDLAPGTAAYPFVTIAFADGMEEHTQGGGTAGNYVVYSVVVKALDTSPQGAESAYATAHAAMCGTAAWAPASGTILGAPRGILVGYHEALSGGTVVHHVGGVYRVHAQ